MHVGRHARRSILDVAGDPRSALHVASLETMFHSTRLRLNRVDMRTLYVLSYASMKHTCAFLFDSILDRRICT